jgi:hypothetical protein
MNFSYREAREERKEIFYICELCVLRGEFFYFASFIASLNSTSALIGVGSTL